MKTVARKRDELQARLSECVQQTLNAARDLSVYDLTYAHPIPITGCTCYACDYERAMRAAGFNDIKEQTVAGFGQAYLDRVKRFHELMKSKEPPSGDEPLGLPMASPLSVPCPSCLVRVGRPCVSSTKRAIPYHKSRLFLFQEVLFCFKRSWRGVRGLVQLTSRKARGAVA